MAGTWFLARVKYEKTLENGMRKKVTEQYLMEALSFTEAEARTIEELTPYISGEMKVVGLNPMNLNEVWPSDSDEADKWYKIKSNFITLNEKSGCEKKTAFVSLIQSSSTSQAEKDFNERMKGTLADYVVEGVVETKIMDVYPYNLERETEETR